MPTTRLMMQQHQLGAAASPVDEAHQALGCAAGSGAGCSWRLGAQRPASARAGDAAGGRASGWALAGRWLLASAWPWRSGSAGCSAGRRGRASASGVGAQRESRRSRLTMPRASSRLLALIPSRTWRCVVGRQVVEREGRCVSSTWCMSDAGHVGLDAAEDRDVVAVVGDVVLVLASTGSRRPRRSRRSTSDDGEHGEPARPGEPARRRGARSASPRGRRSSAAGPLDRLELAGVGRRGPPGRRRARAGAAPRRPRPTSIGPVTRGRGGLGVVDGVVVDDVGDDDGDVVGAAGVERRADQRDGGVVGGALAEEPGEVVVGEHARAAVGAEQDPVTERRPRG